MPTAWLETVSAEILRTDQAVRQALARIKAGEDRFQATRPIFMAAVTMAATEARTLLRASMPVQLIKARTKQPTAVVIAALSELHNRLLALNDPLQNTASAETAAHDLIDALRLWTTALRWKRTCLNAGQRLSIIAITQRQTSIHQERLQNIAGSLTTPNASEVTPRQCELDLKQPIKSTIHDVRQINLPLAA